MEWKIIVDICIAFNFIFFVKRSIKLYEENKQLKADYNELFKQVEELMHENNMLKKHGTDMT